MITMANRIEILKKLNDCAVFTVKTIKDDFDKEKNYAKLIVYRLKKAGLVFELEKNKYTVHQDPLVVASHIVWPSYITSWAALQYHHMTEQLPWTIDVVTSRHRKKKQIKFANAKINFIKTKPENIFGFKKVYYRGFKIFVADKEKAIADSFVFRKISEEELIEIVLKSDADLDLKLIKKCVKKMSGRRRDKRIEHFCRRLV